MPISAIKIVSIVGTLLGIAGTLVSGYASQKQQEETIAQKVAEALAEQTKES